MPDRELPEHIKAQLDRELTAGTPLTSPLPAQARYAQLAPAPMSSRQRWRLLSAVGAAAALIAVTALAGPPQAREWIGHSVGTLAHDVQRSTGDDTPSPEKSPAQQPSAVPPSPHESPEPSESPEASQSPEPTESPEPSESPEVHESPQPSPSSSPEGDHGGSSPSPEPSDGGSHN